VLESANSSGEELLRQIYRESKGAKKKVKNWRRVLKKCLTNLLTVAVEKSITNGTFLPADINGKEPNLQELSTMINGMDMPDIILLRKAV